MWELSSTSKRLASDCDHTDRQEGRALGEVVKYMVYNRRKRGGDNASEYFNNTAMVAGVKDARHQALMPDVLHFLGVKHITNLISMSNLKYDAIIASGITVQVGFVKWL